MPSDTTAVQTILWKSHSPSAEDLRTVYVFTLIKKHSTGDSETARELSVTAARCGDTHLKSQQEEADANRHLKLEASLFYTVNSRPARAT